MHMQDSEKNRTKNCPAGFKCLEKNNKRHPRCKVEHAFGDEFMFVNSATDKPCPHRMPFGGGYICDCPTHFTLHAEKHASVQSPVDVDGAATPSQGNPGPRREGVPETVAAAVSFLMAELPMRDKMAIANMSVEEVGDATPDLFDQIRVSFDLDAGNPALLRSCAAEAGGAIEHAEDAAAFLLACLVRELRKVYRLKSV